MGLESLPLKMNIMLESNTLKSIMLVRRLGVPVSVNKKHSFYVSLGHATQQQKLQSSP